VAGFYVLSTSDRFSHPMAVVLQGLAALGHGLATSLSTREADGRHLKVQLESVEFDQRDPSDHDDFFLLDITSDLTGYTAEYLENWFESIRAFCRGRSLAVFYSSDDSNHVDFPSDFTVFLAHRNRLMDKNPHAQPLAFGCSSEVLDDARRHWGLRVPRARCVVDNFNPTFRQSVRESLMLSFLPRIQKHFSIDRRSLYGDEYAAQLAASSLLLAYGGEYVRPKTDFWYLEKTMSEIDKQRYSFKHREADIAIFRWDSWRFWEGLAYGAVPIQLDFREYGFELPVMPTPWEHYVPIRLHAIEETVDRLSEMLADPNSLDEMSEKAHHWVCEHYHPQAVAQRLLTRIGVS